MGMHDDDGGKVMRVRNDSSSSPEARTTGLLVERVASEAIVYDVDTGAAHCLKPVAAAVFARCDGRSSVEAISATVSADIGAPVGVDAVEEALAQLHECALLEAPGPEQVEDGRVSRRLMLRKTALAGGAAMAAPLIASIVAPNPAFAAVTCNAGTTCTDATDCTCPTSSSCTPSGTSGTCLCKVMNTTPASCGPTAVCVFHPPTSSGMPCIPDCANGEAPCDNTSAAPASIAQPSGSVSSSSSTGAHSSGSTSGSSSSGASSSGSISGSSSAGVP